VPYANLALKLSLQTFLSQKIGCLFCWNLYGLQCFDTWLGGRKGIRPVKNRVVGYWRGYLSGARCRLAFWPSWCHCHSLSLAAVKSRLVLPFWYRLTQVVLEKRPLNGCSSYTVYFTHTHYCLKALCPVLPVWASTGRNIHSLTSVRKKKDSHRQWGLLWASKGC